MKILLIAFILLGASTSSLYSQNKSIKGRIITDYLETLPHVAIMINDTVEVGKTDSNGFFQIDIPVSVKKLVFNALGLESASIGVADTCDPIEVVMIYSGSYDFMTLRKVHRLRMKRFKQLPKIHKEAFEKGIFKTEKACYTREFMP